MIPGPRDQVSSVRKAAITAGNFIPPTSVPSPSSSLGCRELSPLGKAALAIGTIITVVALIPMIDLQVVWRCALKRELGNSVPRADHSGHAKD